MVRWVCVSFEVCRHLLVRLHVWFSRLSLGDTLPDTLADTLPDTLADTLPDTLADTI